MKHAFCKRLAFLILLAWTDSGLIYSNVSAGEVSSTSNPSLSSGSKRNIELAPNIPSDATVFSEPEGKSRRRLSISELYGPLLMNEEAKEKAAINQGETTGGTGSFLSNDTEEEPRSNAMINLQKSAATPLQDATVSPMHQRLLSDDSSKRLNSDSYSSVVLENTRQEFAKLWWVNLWIQQLPANDQGEHSRTNHSLHSGGDIPEERIETAVSEREAQPAQNESNEDPLIQHSCPEQNAAPQNEDELQKFIVSNTELKTEIEPMGDSSLENSKGVDIGFAENAFISSGLWVVIDNVITFGLASKRRKLRLSRHLRSTRKLFARLTGFHGLLSGKSYPGSRFLDTPGAIFSEKTAAALDHDSSLGKSSDKRLDHAKKEKWNDLTDEINSPELFGMEEEERARLERVKTIDRLIVEGQERLQQLICEKDILQRRPNPLFDYTTQSTKTSESADGDDTEASSIDHATSRQFKFPPDDLVDEYLEMIFWSRRLTKMNHTYLWKDVDPQEEDERIGEDFLATESPDVQNTGSNKNPRTRTKSGGGGSWLLRQSIGKGPSLGEKIGESVERAAYKAVTGAVMSALARALSGLHGLNVLKNADISLMLENSPALPPLENAHTDYAHDALKKVFRTKSRHRKKRHKQRSADKAYIQKDAVTEMLLSQAQISAPLLQFFPQAWQRALLGNIITLSTAVISDFFDGLQFQILGYQLSFSFKPITQEDMINHLGFTRADDRRGKLGDFEAAVKATARDIAEELKFLDRWHERALGSGILRTQIANLIARVVLALVDDILRDSRMNLWSAHAGGPRIIAGLEYRTPTNKITTDL